MYWPFWLGLGGPLGPGTQPFPWIHIDDVVNLFVFALENPEARGVLNGVSPTITTNAEYTRALGAALHRPAFIPSKHTKEEAELREEARRRS